MKEKVNNYFSKYWLSLILSLIIFAGLPALISIAFFGCAPITWIAETHSADASDIYLSTDITQQITFNRTVHYTHEAQIIRELNLYNTNNKEVLYKRVVTIIDEESSGLAIVHYTFPEGLNPGDYFWSIGITRSFNYGVTRYVEFDTNVFHVYE